MTDALGRRTVIIDKSQFCIGRRDASDLRVAGSEISRDHAEILAADGGYVLRDRGSRYGTFVNGEQVTQRELQHGDRIHLGRTGGADLVFLAPEVASVADRAPTTSVVGDLRQIATLLEGLRALGSGRVLDDVLALVMDSAIEVSGAERGFIMLAAKGQLDFKLGRSHGRLTLPGKTFETSRKIPEEVFATGQERIITDLLDGDLANIHMGTVALGIRHVLCVPLRLMRYTDRADAPAEERRIGVLYLDSREKGRLLSSATRSALETLAIEAAVAIENARLYREELEKARLEHDMRIAAEIQQALLPKALHAGAYYEAAAATLPCRSIGGDFYDYVDLPNDEFGFALGDVAGKGAPAALLSAMLSGMFLAQATATDDPAVTVARINQSLIRRAVEARFVTLFCGTLCPDGRLTYCNAGHNPPLLVQRGRARRLEKGGPVLGLFDEAHFEKETLQIQAGDFLVVFSDGISEALNEQGEEFGEARLVECITAVAEGEPRVLVERVFGSVRAYTAGAPQSDDITAMVVRYRG